MKYLAIILFLTLSIKSKAQDSLTIEMFKKLPVSILNLESESSRDSLLKYRAYLDPNGDSIEQVRFNLIDPKSFTRNLSYQMSFTTGQSGFSKESIAVELNGKDTLIYYTNSSGSRALFNANRIRIFKYSNELITELNTKQPEINQLNLLLESTPDSIKQAICGQGECFNSMYEFGRYKEKVNIYLVIFSVIDYEEDYMKYQAVKMNFLHDEWLLEFVEDFEADILEY